MDSNSTNFLDIRPISSLIGAVIGGYILGPRLLFTRKFILGPKILYGIQDRPQSQTFDKISRAYFPALMALSIKSIAPQQRATAMGFYQAVYAVGMIAGPMVSGVLADNMGLSSVFYLSASLLLVIVGMAFLPVLRKDR